MKHSNYLPYGPSVLRPDKTSTAAAAITFPNQSCHLVGVLLLCVQQVRHQNTRALWHPCLNKYCSCYVNGIQYRENKNLSVFCSLPSFFSSTLSISLCMEEFHPKDNVGIQGHICKNNEHNREFLTPRAIQVGSCGAGSKGLRTVETLLLFRWNWIQVSTLLLTFWACCDIHLVWWFSWWVI